MDFLVIVIAVDIVVGRATSIHVFNTTDVVVSGAVADIAAGNTMNVVATLGLPISPTADTVAVLAPSTILDLVQLFLALGGGGTL